MIAGGYKLRSVKTKLPFSVLWAQRFMGARVPKGGSHESHLETTALTTSNPAKTCRGRGGGHHFNFSRKGSLRS